MVKKDKDKKNKNEMNSNEFKEKQNKQTQEQSLEVLNEKIESLENEKAELSAKLQRVLADYDNFQKRVPKQIEERVAYKVEAVIKAFLPGIDNFEHALKAEQNHDVESILKGIKIVYDHLVDILKGEGIEQIKSLDEQFDPSLHRAMMQRAEQDKENGIVLEEYQKGYKLNGKVIRPAMVIVNKLPQENEENAKPNNSDENTSDSDSQDNTEKD